MASGHDSKGGEWSYWCRTEGPKAAIRANNIVHLPTCTGTATSEQTVPRRAYNIRIPRVDADCGSLCPAYRWEYIWDDQPYTDPDFEVVAQKMSGVNGTA